MKLRTVFLLAIVFLAAVIFLRALVAVSPATNERPDKDAPAISISSPMPLSYYLIDNRRNEPVMWVAALSPRMKLNVFA